MHFVRVPSGIYRIGISLSEQRDLEKSGLTFYLNRGIQAVYVRGFWISATPVTVEQYLSFENRLAEDIARPHNLKRDANRPVATLSAKAAARYAKSQHGRLPTAIEWEAAARGVDLRRYPWGNDHKPQFFNLVRPVSVGKNAECASPFGVQDLVGGVMEWTSDVLEGRAIVKGCAYNGSDTHLAADAAYRPSSQIMNVGFRYVALD